MKVGPPGPNYKRLKLDPNRPIVIDLTDDDPHVTDFYFISDDEDDDESSSSDGGHSSDDDIEIIEDKSTPVPGPNDPGPSSRHNSTDREVEANDDIDWDRVRLPSSDDEESVDPSLVLRGPNPMIPGLDEFFILN